MADYLWNFRPNYPTKGVQGFANVKKKWNIGYAGKIFDVLDDGLFRSSVQIRKKTGLRNSIVSGTLNRLLKKGGVERVRNPKSDETLLHWQTDVPKYLYRITNLARNERKKNPAD